MAIEEKLVIRDAAIRAELSERQWALLQQVRKIAEHEIGPAAWLVDHEARYPQEAMEALKAAGLIGAAVPEAAGGHGAGYGGDVVLLPLLLMELASWCSSASQVFALHNTGVQLVHALGSEKQQSFLFNEVIGKGQLFASFGSEASADRFKLGSELSIIQGGYLLNGTKIFATGSPAAKWAIWRSVLSEASGSQEERFRMPIVDLEASGITIKDDWDGIGQRGTGSGTVVAVNVFVPNEHLIGDTAGYGKVQLFFNTQFHIHFAAQYVGIADGALREAVQYLKAKSRSITAGIPVIEESLIQVRIGEMDAKLESARQLVLRAARLLQAAQANTELYPSAAIAASQAKVVATTVSLEVTSDVFQLMGARAAARKYGFDRYWRNARTLTLHDPVDKQREWLGRSVLQE
ncbi:acyl-CoA dehydrogenase family protein [Paenibacillus sinopodophylli]|uniref:acyl-CoA dehydrogenase family protein n=1 Tax=Paenibacillus sinopodophylli TaxID=1837342 RepID=UPI0014875BC1|nr:acyl-CoA dehydrogenase family protein [Paenibacillus sinopodophylli]